jgi:hypothetical protein
VGIEQRPEHVFERLLAVTPACQQSFATHIAQTWLNAIADGEQVFTTVLDLPASERFFAGLRSLDHALETTTFEAQPAATIFQGPIADALTHVGQLALMRGAAGVPVRPESYARAEIRLGHVGRDQSASRKEFDGDASHPKK